MYKDKLGVKLNTEDNDLKKVGNNYFQLHTYLALAHLFSLVSQEFAQPLSVEILSKDNYCKMGIISSTQPLAFIHQTYVDFLVARY